MFDYSRQLDAFRQSKVRLSSTFKETLVSHRNANRKRLISRLPDFIKGVDIGESNFKPQGSVAMGTVIQTKFVDQEYDIDDGLVIPRSQLKNDDGTEMTSADARAAAKSALEDTRFKRQPKLHPNCVRVFYADEDPENHHVDVAIYRRWSTEEGNAVRELANETNWILSDPTQVNSWFEALVEERNKEVTGWGTQLRHLIHLLKRYCRSRKAWIDELPNGMKLSMLVAECQADYSARTDVAFRNLIANLVQRLRITKVIENLAHPELPKLTRTDADANVVALLEKALEALEQLESLDEPSNGKEEATRKVWEWIFQSDGFFSDYDASAKVEKSEGASTRSSLTSHGGNVRRGPSTKAMLFRWRASMGTANMA